jgi:hypothetical protein
MMSNRVEHSRKRREKKKSETVQSVILFLILYLHRQNNLMVHNTTAEVAARNLTAEDPSRNNLSFKRKIIGFI